MLSEYNLIKEEPNNIKEFIQKGLASNFLQTALERIIQIFQVLLPTTSLWAAVRQYIPGEGIFITAKRAGNYNPKRKEFTQPIKKDRSISKMIREQFKKDGVGIIITHPGEPLYDEADGDKFQENLSIMAGPIVRHRESNKGQIITEMPMWIALNSPEEKAFQEGLKSYMSICLETISELLGTWPKIIKGTK